MSFLIRRTRRTAWTGETRNLDEAIREFTRSSTDTDGLSVFEVKSDDDRELVVAAIACERENTGAVDWIEIDRAALEEFGAVSHTPDHGQTVIAAVNKLHHSLDWDEATFRALATKLFEECVEPKRYAPSEVKKLVKKLPVDNVAESARAFVAEVQRPKKG